MKILKNARIYTLDNQQSVASAIAIQSQPGHSGRIIAIGENEQILQEYGEKALIEDINGAVILPGLTDAHLHLLHYARSLQKANLFGCSKAECLERIRDLASKTAPGEWVLGHGWNQNLWAEGFGNAADLDKAAPNNPVYLTTVSLHAAWVNSAALKAAGIEQNTPNPENGEFQRDSAGRPTGILFEYAMRVVSSQIPEPSETENAATIEHAQGKLWQLGLTGVHDFDRRRSFVALQHLHQEKRLKMRVLKSMPVERLDHIIESGLRTGFGDDILRIGSIKLFADGALGPHTAAMLQPYLGEPENTGMLFMDGEEFFEIGQKASQNGLSLTMHAIGDAANNEMLKGYTQLRKFEQEKQLPHLRHRMEHVQILHPDDLMKLTELDIIASMQPIHATADMDMADTSWGERSRYAYAWKTLLNNKTKMAFGSDAPVDSPNPFHGIHAAVTRQRADGSPGPDGWYPEERVSVLEALLGYSQGPAYSANMENRLGHLAPGYLADLIVVDNDPFTCEPAQLREIRPQATMLGGEWVWRA